MYMCARRDYRRFCPRFKEEPLQRRAASKKSRFEEGGAAKFILQHPLKNCLRALPGHLSALTTAFRPEAYCKACIDVFCNSSLVSQERGQLRWVFAPAAFTATKVAWLP
jgi:hypothetical protein